MEDISTADYSMDLVFDNMADGIYYRHIASNGDRRYIYFNSVMKEFFECNDVTSSHYWKQYLDDEHDDIVLSTSEPYREEYPIRDEMGNVIRWLIFIKKKVDASILGDDGHYIITTVADITRRKEDEILLERSRLNLKLAMDAGKMSTWDFDIGTKIFTITNGLDVKSPTISLEEHIMLRQYNRERSIANGDFWAVMKGRKESGHDSYIVEDKDTGEIRYRRSSFMGIKVDGVVKHIIGTTQDETELYHQKQLIKKSMDEIFMALEAGNIAAWSYTVKDRMFHTLYGVPVAGEGKSYQDMLDLIHPDDVTVLASAINSIVSLEKESIYCVCRFLSDGAGSGYRHYGSRMMRVVEDGEVIKVVGTQRDITEECLLQTQLKEKDNLMRIVVNNLLDGVMLCTDECYLVWSNNAMANTFMKAMNRKNVSGGQFCEFLVRGKCIRGERCLIKEALNTNSVQVEVRQYGSDVRLELTAIPVIDSEDDTKQALLKVHDVSESKKLLQKLNEMKELAESRADFVLSLINRMPCAIFIINPDNDCRIEIVNRFFCEMLNIEEADLVGKNNKEIFGEEEAAKFDSYDLLLISGSESTISYEASMTIDDKKMFWRINKSIVVLDGRKLILAVSTDITDLKNLNQDLVDTKEKALVADKLKTAFLANMSHEIRTPLNAIVGFSQLLSGSDDPQEKQEFSKIINNNTQMLLSLISDILDLSKIESGNSQFKRSLVDVSEYFNELTASLALKVTNPDVSFIVNNPYKACYVNMDKIRFGQVVTNFVTNAIKYTKKGYIKVGYYIERHGVTIKVEDTGMGISPDKRDRVFKRFDKLDSMVQGTGLGLSIVKVLTEIGGGKVWFESEEGKGSTFYSWKPFNDIRIKC